MNDIKPDGRITFKTNSYRSNADFAELNESIITEHNGIISKVRITENRPPFIVGEYSFSSWNLKLGKMLDADVTKLVKQYGDELAYSQLSILIENNIVDLSRYDTLIMLHNLIIHPNYRKHEMTEEYIEFIYREFYNKKTLILALVKPIQDNPIDYDYYFKNKVVEVRDVLGKLHEYTPISALSYYSLNDLLLKKDRESNEYKLFALAQKCGFEKLRNSYLFEFHPEKTLKRILRKPKTTYLDQI